MDVTTGLDRSDSERPSKRISLDLPEEKVNETTVVRTNFRPQIYSNKLILAPMVRANSLPFRLICLRSGADLVYSEELIDHRVATCKRVENELLETVDFIDKDGRVIFRTCAEERDKIVFQLGSNDPDRALKAARLVCKDVIGIDFNFGCPKKFSIAGGMGAALLEQPERIKAILSHCVENLDVSVTCKIRILPNLDDTIKLVKLIQSCGVSAIAVHGRTRDQRPNDENNIEVIRSITENVNIPVIANGESNNIKNHIDIMEFKKKTKASSVMIARTAMKNPSIFSNAISIINPDLGSPLNGTRREINFTDTLLEYVKLCVKYDNHPSNVKYSLQSLLASQLNEKEFVRKLYSANDLEKICDVFELTDWFNKNQIKSC